MSAGYLAEIAEQPDILRRLATDVEARHGRELSACRERILAGEFDRVVLTGMGGSLHGVHPGLLALANGLQLPVAAWDASELTQQAPAAVGDRTLVIAVSQSGESAELKRLAAPPRRPGLVIGVTNQRPNTLADWADIAVATEAGPERTASTKTYTAGLAALHLVVAVLLGRERGAAAAVAAVAGHAAAMLPGLPEAAGSAARFLGHDAPLVCIGRGASHASAQMAALLTEEAAKLPCQGLTGGQFRHGPLELVREGFRAILFAGSGETLALNARLAQEIVRLGGRVLAIGPELAAFPQSDGLRTLPIPTAPPDLLPVLEILPVQFLVIPLAEARGFVPAAFLNASKITSVE